MNNSSDLSIRSLILKAQYDLKYSESKIAISEGTNKIDEAIKLIHRDYNLNDNVRELKNKYGALVSLPNRKKLTKEERSTLK